MEYINIYRWLLFTVTAIAFCFSVYYTKYWFVDRGHELAQKLISRHGDSFADAECGSAIVCATFVSALSKAWYGWLIMVTAMVLFVISIVR